MAEGRNGLTDEQRAALWKWRWLGWRHATPAFRVSVAVLTAMLVALGLLALALRATS